MSDDRRYTDPATTRLPSTTTPTPPRSGWVADPDTPSGWKWIPDLTRLSAATHLLPVVPAPLGRIDYQGAVDWAWPPGDPTFTQDDGSTYARCEPDEFDDYSDVDSTTIVDPGAPG